MPHFSEVLDLAQVASTALTALEETAKARTLAHFQRYENGLSSYGQLRIDLLAQARTGWITAGSTATQHMADIGRQFGLPRFDTPLTNSNEVLESILGDMVRNLEAFRDSDRDATALRRLRYRSVLSVQAAVRMGFTCNQLSVAKNIQDLGATLKKVWLCNFNDNIPCQTCLWLHGREIDIDEVFPDGHSERDPKVYLTLQGPPRHPNCHCYMLVYVVTLETSRLEIMTPVPVEDKFMTSRDVRQLPKAVYVAAVSTLRIIAGKLKEALRGNR